MGPIRSLTGLIDDVRAQTREVESAVDRMREANRRLTGSTGQAPTPLAAIQNGISGQNAVKEPVLPLMVELTSQVEKLNSATADLRAEISYMETLSETGSAREPVPSAYAAQGGIAVGR